MLKKYIAIFAMSLAWIILFGHSIIPHNHHDKEELMAYHALQSDHDQLSAIFSHFFHGEDGILLSNTKSSDDYPAKHFIAILTVLFGEFFVNPINQATAPFPVQPNLVYRSPHLVCLGLRAPPVFVG